MRFSAFPCAISVAVVLILCGVDTDARPAAPLQHFKGLSFGFEGPTWSMNPFSSLANWLSKGIKESLWSPTPTFDGHGHGHPEAPHFVLYGNSDNGAQHGVPEPENIEGFNTYNVAFYTTKGPQGALESWTKAKDDDRAALKKKYADKGISLVVSVGGEGDKPQSDKRDPHEYAQEVAKFVKKYNFDGADLDYEEFDIFGRMRVVWWLVVFTKALRQELGPNAVITHAPVAPWFSQKDYSKGSYLDFHKQAGDAVSWYNIQYYNQGGKSYTHCETLLNNGTRAHFPATSIFEIHKEGNIPLDKLVIGKPATPQDATNGYLSTKGLGKCLRDGATKGYKGGAMFYEYPHMNGKKLKQLRDAARY